MFLFAARANISKKNTHQSSFQFWGLSITCSRVKRCLSNCKRRQAFYQIPPPPRSTIETRLNVRRLNEPKQFCRPKCLKRMLSSLLLTLRQMHFVASDEHCILHQQIRLPPPPPPIEPLEPTKYWLVAPFVPSPAFHLSCVVSKTFPLESSSGWRLANAHCLRAHLRSQDW